MNKKLMYLLALGLGLQVQSGFGSCKQEERIKKGLEHVHHSEKKIEIQAALAEIGHAHHKGDHEKLREADHKLQSAINNAASLALKSYFWTFVGGAGTGVAAVVALYVALKK
jgi:hypothetical protein